MKCVGFITCSDDAMPNKNTVSRFRKKPKDEPHWKTDVVSEIWPDAAFGFKLQGHQPV